MKEISFMDNPWIGQLVGTQLLHLIGFAIKISTLPLLGTFNALYLGTEYHQRISMINVPF